VIYQLDRREVLRARAVLMLQAVEDIQRELAELEGKDVSPGQAAERPAGDRRRGLSAPLHLRRQAPPAVGR